MVCGSAGDPGRPHLAFASRLSATFLGLLLAVSKDLNRNVLSRLHRQAPSLSGDQIAPPDEESPARPRPLDNQAGRAWQVIAIEFSSHLVACLDLRERSRPVECH